MLVTRRLLSSGPSRLLSTSSRRLLGSGSSVVSSPRLLNTSAGSPRPPLRHRAFDWLKDDLVPYWRRLAFLYKGATVVVGSAVVYHLVNERGQIATTNAMLSTFEAGGVSDWDRSYSGDLLASVERPQLEEELHKLLHPDISKNYAVVIGGTGIGKSTAVRQAVRSLPSPKGVVYFMTPKEMETFSTDLAAQVGYRGKELNLGDALKRWIEGTTKSDDGPPVRSEPLASWLPLKKKLVAAADEFFAKHHRPMVLVFDAFDRVCKEDPDFALKLQALAKDGADTGHLRVVFVFSKDTALPLLTSQSAWKRALPPLEVFDIPDFEAVNFLVGRDVEQARAEDAVRTITGGRFSDMLVFAGASATKSNDVIRQELDRRIKSAVVDAGMQPTHPVFARLLSSPTIPTAEVKRLLSQDQLKTLLVSNVLAVHADKTISFQTRHVSHFFKGPCLCLFSVLSMCSRSASIHRTLVHVSCRVLLLLLLLLGFCLYRLPVCFSICLIMSVVFFVHSVCSPVCVCFCAEPEQKTADDPFALLPDTATMEEVLRMVAKERGYTEDQLESTRTKLSQSLVVTVGNLRVLSKEHIIAYDLPDVVKIYLLRVLK